MPNFSDQIKFHVPGHYLTDYPKFVLFIEKYYEWLYRQGGFTAAEKSLLIEERDWLQANIDKFIETGLITDIANSDDEVEQAIQLMSSMKNPGSVSQDLIKDFILERSFSVFDTSEEEVFETADGHALEAKELNQSMIDMWINTQGFFIPATGSEVGRLDQILLVRLIKHISLVKGTQKAAELFFSMFFDEDISANNGGNGAFYKPKYDIFTIDEITSLIDDKNSVIRDDYYYNEFSYVIKVKNPPEFYKLAFESVYLKYIHPAGFMVFLQQADPDEIVRERHEFYRASQATFINNQGFMELVGFDVARFEKNVLLLEQGAVNLAIKSIEVDTNDGWVLGTDTTRVGKTTSPFGTQNATQYAAISEGVVTVRQTISVEQNTDYCFSYFINTGSGWSRLNSTFNTGSSDMKTIEIVYEVLAGEQVSFSCAQLEKGTIPTSYIPTFISGAARAPDILVDEVS